MEKKRVVVYGSLMVIIVLTVYFLSGYYIDRSHTVEQANTSGAPGINSLWKQKEYKAFNTYLMNLSEDEDYPMLSSSKSARLFSHFIASITNASPDLVRDGNALILVAKLRSLAQSTCILYIQKSEETNKYQNEIAHLRGMQISLLLDMQLLAKNIIEKVSKNDVNYSINLKGVRMLQEGASMQLIGFTEILAQSDYINQNRILLDYFRTYVPDLLVLMDTQKRKMIKQKIIEASDEVLIAYIKNVLHTIGATPDL